MDKATQNKTKGSGVTPMMTQFLKIKAENEDCLLFYRMGDFYEMFFDDAKKAAAALDITLTKRGRHNGEDIPMCGVPVHAADTYLSRLIRKGFRVAVCEQVEDPAEAKKRGAKAVVRREVLRVVTPGTLIEDTLLDARRNNYLAAVGVLVQGTLRGCCITFESVGRWIIMMNDCFDLLRSARFDDSGRRIMEAGVPACIRHVKEAAEGFAVLRRAA